MRPRCIPPLAAFILLAAAGAAHPDTVCRPDALGGVRCAARPMPRPPSVPDRRTPGLALQPKSPTPSTQFVPARETNRLGTTFTDRPVRGVCRPDQLGNLRCR